MGEEQALVRCLVPSEHEHSDHMDQSDQSPSVSIKIMLSSKLVVVGQYPQAAAIQNSMEKD